MCIEKSQCSDHKMRLQEKIEPGNLLHFLDKKSTHYEKLTGQRKPVLSGKESKQDLGNSSGKLEKRKKELTVQTFWL